MGGGRGGAVVGGGGMLLEPDGTSDGCAVVDFLVFTRSWS